MQRNAVILAGMALAAFICLLALPALVSERGAFLPSTWLAEQPVRAFLTVAGCLAGATLIAAAVARFTNAAIGTFVLGCGVFALAGRTHTAEEAARTGSLRIVPLEVLAWAVLAVVAMYGLFRLSGWLDDVEPLERDGRERRPHWLLSVEALKASAAGLVVLPTVWLLAITAMKGQVIAAVAIGSVVAGLVGRIMSPHVQPVALIASPLVFGAVGCWWGLTKLGGGASQADVATLGELSRLCLPMPLDYLAGTFIGMPMGYGWARSFLQHEDEEEAEPSVHIRRAAG